MANKKITDLTAATTLNNDDLLPCVSGIGATPVTQKITVANLRNVVGTGNTIIPSLPSGGDFSQSALANNVISFSDIASSGIQEGDVCSFAQNGSTHYYLVTDITFSSPSYLVTLAGPSISTSFNVGDITVYSKSRSINTDIVFSGAYAVNGTTSFLINRETGTKFRWNGPKAYLLYFVARNNEADGSGTAPEINVTVARADSLGTRNSVFTFVSGGLPVSGTGWNASSNNVLPAHYSINFGDELEVSLLSVGGDGDARDLTVSFVFALES